MMQENSPLRDEGEKHVPPIEILKNIMSAVTEIHEFVKELMKEREELKREREALAAFIHIDQELMQKIFRVSKRTLQRWRDEKRVPYHITSTGGYCYYLFDEVEVALKRGTISCKLTTQTEAIARLDVFKKGIIQGKSIEDIYAEFD